MSDNCSLEMSEEEIRAWEKWWDSILPELEEEMVPDAGDEPFTEDRIKVMHDVLYGEKK